jgi:2-polyprenyl-3-methyl-5-hydroxy-6-metoxy-1,4-benzoquinol methylase
MEEIKNLFTETYINDFWNMGDGESKSGLGSSLLYTENFRKNLLNIIKKLNIEKIFDCSCGDWNWMKEIHHEFKEYIGNDVVEEIINVNNEKYSNDRIKFICGDMVKSLSIFSDSYFDLIICRHTLEHLPTNYVKNALSEIKKKSKFAIITNSTQDINIELVNFDGVSSRGINLNSEPYLNILNEPEFVFFDSFGDEIICDKTTPVCTGNLFNFLKQ